MVLLKGSLDQACKIDLADFISFYGLKAAGLCLVPSHWTPPYFLISNLLYKRYKDRRIHSADPNPSDILNQEELDLIKDGLDSVIGDDNEQIYIRSSAIQESINDRGRYNSIICRGEINELIRHMLELYRQVASCESTIMGLVIQRYIEPIKAIGHLSNERRLSYQKATWWCEYESNNGSSKIERFSTSKVRSQAKEDSPMRCLNEKDMQMQIKITAKWALRHNKRLHYEWIWDGMHLWIVQQDFEPQPTKSAVFSSISTRQASVQLEDSVFLLLKSEESIESGAWKKIDRVKIFRNCNLPVARLWILNDLKIFKSMLLGNASRDLDCELKKLLEFPVVIRTDLQRVDESDCGYMLPRSSTIERLEDAIEFILKTIKAVSNDQEERLERLCFIFHHYIPSRSSAICLAEPGNQKVRIDSIWGFPDGLHYYPHDSYELNSNGHGKIKRYRRFKEECLDLDPLGNWIPRKVEPPFDWQLSLSDSELSDIAIGSTRLANYLNSCVQVIWFIGIPANIGHPSSLPFFYTLEEPPVAISGDNLDARVFYTNREPGTIREPGDLDYIRSKAARSEPLPPVLRLRPKSSLIRCSTFLAEVAEFAKQYDLSIELEGSILSHAYYILKSTGVRIVCINPFLPKYKKIKHGKLVRDLIPARISAQGETVKVIEVADKQLPNLLKAKVLEEAYELFWAEQPVDMSEELADIYEVIRTFATKLGISIEDVHQLADKKKSERGGFEHGFILDETEENPLVKTEDEPLSSLLRFDYSSSIIEKRLPRLYRTLNEPHVKGNNLIIPFIPPSPSRRHVGFSVSIERLSIVATISFHEKQIVVSLTKSQETSSAAIIEPLQLDLFGRELPG
jgi:predicted house-cleaning noncanonical NTP pyrophosphatase (MazG superfamily)